MYITFTFTNNYNLKVQSPDAMKPKNKQKK